MEVKITRNLKVCDRAISVIFNFISEFHAFAFQFCNSLLNVITLERNMVRAKWCPMISYFIWRMYAHIALWQIKDQPPIPNAWSLNPSFFRKKLSALQLVNCIARYVLLLSYCLFVVFINFLPSINLCCYMAILHIQLGINALAPCASTWIRQINLDLGYQLFLS